MANLLNVDSAIASILETISRIDTESIALPDSINRVLASDLVSDINLPPFDNSAMDGFAIRAENSNTIPATLRVVMDIPAGTLPTKAIEDGEAARIMTGAPVPQGATAVIPVEETDADFSDLDHAPLQATVTIKATKAYGANIREAGENIRKGDLLLTAGTLIRPAEIGLLAALGQSTVEVYRKPRVAIIGSGDEIVDIDAPLEAGKIRDVNSYALEALVTQHGAEAIRLPIAGDSAEEVRDLFNTALDHKPDMIISSAGVSMGAADYVRAILDEMGDIGFWKINLRPGKPLAYGNVQGVPFFGLPGNPVSAMITFHVLVKPALFKMSHRQGNTNIVKAITGEAMGSDGRRTYARVILREENGQTVAYETGTQSSGAFISMVKADGLLIIPEGIRDIPAGTELAVQLI